MIGICRASFYFLLTSGTLTVGQMSNSGLSQLQQEGLARMQQARMQQAQRKRAEEAQMQRAEAAKMQQRAEAARMQRAEEARRAEAARMQQRVEEAKMQQRAEAAKVQRAKEAKMQQLAEEARMQRVAAEQRAAAEQQRAKQAKMQQMAEEARMQRAAAQQRAAAEQQRAAAEQQRAALAKQRAAAASQTNRAAPYDTQLQDGHDALARLFGTAPDMQERAAPSASRAKPILSQAAPSGQRTKVAYQMDDMRREALGYTSTAQRVGPASGRVPQASQGMRGAVPRAGRVSNDDTMAQLFGARPTMDHSQASRAARAKQMEEEEEGMDTDELAGSIMEGFDSNKDGKISLYELMDHVGDAHHSMPEFEGWHEGFSQADDDGDMHLTIEELSTLLKNVGNQETEMKISDEKSRHAAIAASIMDGLDSNGDGKIGLQELLSNLKDEHHHAPEFKGWHKGFQQADADHDMHLTVDELANLLMAANEEEL
mmetsp:Transcript_157614/g.302557  ORF Transcript_157614/g.302557 Transcript_157614/m.302557 type:complete len:485 (+) Transcript_157614:108-1562(+)